MLKKYHRADSIAFIILLFGTLIVYPFQSMYLDVIALFLIATRTTYQYFFKNKMRKKNIQILLVCFLAYFIVQDIITIFSFQEIGIFKVLLLHISVFLLYLFSKGDYDKQLNIEFCFKIILGYVIAYIILIMTSVKSSNHWYDNQSIVFSGSVVAGYPLMLYLLGLSRRTFLKSKFYFIILILLSSLLSQMTQSRSLLICCCYSVFIIFGADSDSRWLKLKYFFICASILVLCQAAAPFIYSKMKVISIEPISKQNTFSNVSKSIGESFLTPISPRESDQDRFNHFRCSIEWLKNDGNIHQKIFGVGARQYGFELSKCTLMIGKNYSSNKNNLYFMRTVGITRIILDYGYIGLIILLVFFMNLIWTTLAGKNFEGFVIVLFLMYSSFIIDTSTLALFWLCLIFLHDFHNQFFKLPSNFHKK